MNIYERRRILNQFWRVRAKMTPAQKLILASLVYREDHCGASDPDIDALLLQNNLGQLEGAMAKELGIEPRYVAPIERPVPPAPIEQTSTFKAAVRKNHQWPVIAPYHSSDGNILTR